MSTCACCEDAGDLTGRVLKEAKRVLEELEKAVESKFKEDSEAVELLDWLRDEVRQLESLIKKNVPYAEVVDYESYNLDQLYCFANFYIHPEFYQ